MSSAVIFQDFLLYLCGELGNPPYCCKIGMDNMAIAARTQIGNDFLTRKMEILVISFFGIGDYEDENYKTA